MAGLQASQSNLTAATEMGNDLVSTQMELAEYTGSQKKINWFAYCGCSVLSQGPYACHAITGPLSHAITGPLSCGPSPFYGRISVCLFNALCVPTRKDLQNLQLCKQRRSSCGMTRTMITYIKNPAI